MKRKEKKEQKSVGGTRDRLLAALAGRRRRQRGGAGEGAGEGGGHRRAPLQQPCSPVAAAATK